DTKGNYEVCHYPSTVTWASLTPSVDPATQQAVESKIRTTAYGLAPQDYVSYCPYWLPSGPNRTPSVTYWSRAYEVHVIDQYADGHTVEVASGSGAYQNL